MEVLRRGLVRRDLKDEKELAQEEPGTECLQAEESATDKLLSQERAELWRNRRLAQWGRLLVRTGENGGR